MNLMSARSPSRWRSRVFAWLLCGWGVAQAQFSPLPHPPHASDSLAVSAKAYRQDGARHLYARYPAKVLRGRLPPLLHGVAVVDTEIDDRGQVLGVQLRRPPAAPEVGPWIRRMILAAAPFPAPQRLGRTVYTEVWLVDQSGRFQLDTLTEGQD